MELRDLGRALKDEEALCAERSRALERQKRRLSRSVEWSELKEALGTCYPHSLCRSWT